MLSSKNTKTGILQAETLNPREKTIHIKYLEKKKKVKNDINIMAIDRIK